MSPSSTTQTPFSSARSPLAVGSPVVSLSPFVIAVPVGAELGHDRRDHDSHEARRAAPARRTTRASWFGFLSGIARPGMYPRLAPPGPIPVQSAARSSSAAAAGSSAPAMLRAAATRIDAGRPGASAGPRSSGRPPWAPTPGIRKIELGHQLAHPPQVLGRRGADHRAHAAEPALARQPPARARRPSPARSSCSGRPSTSPVLEVGGAGVGGAHEAEDPGAAASAAASISGSSASPPSSGLAVKASAPRPATGPHGVSTRRPAPGRRRGACVGTSPRLPSATTSSPASRAAGDDLAQRPPARGAEALEAGELGLDRDAGRARALDQLAALRDDGIGRALGRVAAPARRPRAATAGSGSSPRQTWLRRSP